MLVVLLDVTADVCIIECNTTEVGVAVGLVTTLCDDMGVNDVD